MTTANKITIVRILMIPAFVTMAIYYGQSVQLGEPLEWQRFTAIAIFLVAAVTDLRKANSVLAATLESTADGILVVDRTGTITNVNGRFAEMWRLPLETLHSSDDDALALVLDQLSDPGAFVAKVQARVSCAPHAEAAVAHSRNADVASAPSWEMSPPLALTRLT